jgi:hypothetical protein
VLTIADYTYTPTKLDGAFAESWQRKCQMDSLICVTQAWSQQRPSCFAGNNEMGGRFPDIEAAWVCWATASGELVPTEAELERQRAEQAEQ